MSKLLLAGLAMAAALLGSLTHSDKRLVQTRKAPDHRVTIEYIGNMGVILAGRSSHVVIDGLHEEYGPDYLFPPDTLINKLLLGTPPFSNLQISLATHFHRDHFSWRLVRQFLQQEKDRIFVGPPQAIDSLRIQTWQVPLNVRVVAARNGAVVLMDPRITSFRIRHVWQERHRSVQNFAYLVEMEGVRILHIGDALADRDDFLALRGLKIDVAIVPEWFVNDTTGIEILERLIAPKLVAVAHVSPQETNDRSVERKTFEIVYFNQLYQKIHI